MSRATFTIRPATVEDAPALVELVVIAGEGIPLKVWYSIDGSKDPMVTGIERASRKTGGFSYRNAMIAEVNGQVAGMCLAYRIGAPTEEERDAVSSLPPLLHAFVRLEWLAPNTWYVNALAVFPEYRRLGIADALLDASERQGSDQGVDEASIIVFGNNTPAVELYTTKRGYALKASEPPVDDPEFGPRGDVVLLTKPIKR